MATAVTFNGTGYSIPAAGELNWSALSNFLVDVGNNAQTTTFSKQNTRIATSTPVTVSAATDVNINVNVASATAVELPAGSAGQMFRITDASGAAATNNITIDASGAETINGAANYVINTNNGGVTLAWNGTEWRIVGQVTLGLFDALTVSGSGDRSISITSTSARAQLPLAGVKTGSNGEFAEISAANNGDSVAGIQFVRADNDDQGEIALLTQDTGGGVTERVRVRSGGIKFAGGTSDLGYYEEATHSSDFTLAGAGTKSGSKDLKIVRVGNQVSIVIPGFTCTGNGSSGTTIDMDTPLPTKFRPTGAYLISGGRMQVAGVTQAAPSNLTVTSSGAIFIARDFANPPPNWGTSGSNGHQNSFAFSYNIS